MLADMGNEPDEEQQNIHLLVCSNEIDIEGLIAVTGKYLRKDPRPDLYFKHSAHIFGTGGRSGRADGPVRLIGNHEASR